MRAKDGVHSGARRSWKWQCVPCLADRAPGQEEAGAWPRQTGKGRGKNRRWSPAAQARQGHPRHCRGAASKRVGELGELPGRGDPSPGWEDVSVSPAVTVGPLQGHQSWQVTRPLAYRWQKDLSCLAFFFFFDLSLSQ